MKQRSLTAQGVPGERREWRINWSRILGMAVMVAIAVAIIVPMLPLATWSLSFRWYFPDVIPASLSMRAWKYVFSEASKAPQAVIQGGQISLVATLFSLVIGIPAGRALGLHKFRGKRLVQFLILAPTIIPPLSVAMGIHVAFIRYGLAAKTLGVMLVHLIPTTPYVVMVMASVFANYDPEYEEQAQTLGAGLLRTFIHITLPAIFPGIMVGGMFAFIISWGQYILTLLIGGGRVITLPVLLFSFAASGDNAVTAALCVLFVAPAIIILIFTSKYLTGESAALGGFGA
ncbi:MAG: ABC transporter permease [Chloroflexi bacterium]|nr:ABC transporter permease [Chloroflexota bacterium]